MTEQEQLASLALEGGTYQTRLTAWFKQRKPYVAKDPRAIKALIPGVIENVEVAIGAQVRKGDTLLILEAMKMHNRIKAPHDGVIKAVHVTAGDKVSKGQTLIELD